MDGRKKFQRAGVERDPDDPAGQTSKSALRKNKPGVYNKVQTRGDCEVVLSKLQEFLQEGTAELDVRENGILSYEIDPLGKAKEFVVFE